MARATASWTNTDDQVWIAGSYFRYDKFLAHVLQNIEYLAQTHTHVGGDPNGAALPAAEYKNIFYYGSASPTFG